MADGKMQVWEVWKTDHREGSRPATEELVGKFRAKAQAESFVDSAYRVMVNPHAPGQIVYEIKEGWE